MKKATIFLFGVALVQLACGGGDNSGLIDKDEGGTVCDSTGTACVNIPANALTKDTTVTVAFTDDIVPSPSKKLGEAVLISPTSTLLVKNATLTLPYDAKLVTSGFSTDEAVGFQLTNKEIFRFAGGDDITVDSNAEKMSWPLNNFGTFQPGLKINDLSLGAVTEVPLGGSRGSQQLIMKAGEQYHFFVTAIPDKFDTAPSSVVASQSVRVVSEIPSSLVSALTSGNSPAEPAHEKSDPRAEVEGLLYQRLKAIEARGKSNMQKPGGQVPKINFKPGTGFDFGANGPTIGDQVVVRMLDVSDSDNDSSTSDTITYTAEVLEVTSNHVVILADITGTQPTGTAISNLKNALQQNIVPRLAHFFGDFSDVDNDDYLQVFMTDKIGSGILGFYDAANQFDRDPSGDTNASNLADVLFTTIPNNDELLASTVCHELQHLINFNEKTLKRLVNGTGLVADPNAIPASTPFEEPFVNEGASYFAEMVCGYGPLSAGPVENTELYLSNQSQSSLIDNGGSVGLKIRGANYLFIQYLFDQAGGAKQGSGTSYTDKGGSAFIRELLASEFVGADNYGRTFRSNDPLQRDFFQAFNDFMVTLYNNRQSSPPSSSGRYGFKTLFDDNFTDNPVGMDLAAITTSGPEVKNFDESATQLDTNVKSVGARMIRYGASTSGTAKFTISGQASANLKAMVIRSQ